MTGVNHLTGGVVYTGVFCSFWNVNIFEKPWYLVATLIFSLLPDIDHTKSPLGKILSFTYLPQYLDRNFGHRTITHSLLIYFTLGISVYFIESIFSNDHPFALIFMLAYSSHLVFDMMTISGVPLFFPFKKNPCVIPGNPDYRLKVKDLKSESLIFALFLGILLFCYPLIQQGFWTTYNQQFGTLDHLHREYIGSEDILIVEYDFTDRGKIYKGSGYVVHSEKTKAFVFDGDRLFEITDKMKLASIIPEHTEISRIEIENYFYNINPDSLSGLIDEKLILKADFQCSDKIRYFSSSGYKESNIVKLEYVYNADLTILPDTLHGSAINQLAIKEIELKNQTLHIQEELNEYEAITEEIQDLQGSFNYMRLIDQERSVKRLKLLKTKKENFFFSNSGTEKIEMQIEQLKNEIDQINETTFTGKLITLAL